MSDEAEVAQPSETPEPAGDKLDQAIYSAIDKVEADSPPEPEPGERPRDERGRFAQKTTADAEPSTEPATAPADPATTTTAEPAQQPLEPHPRWSEADKAKFAAAPPEIQQWMLERQNATEAEFTRKTQEFAEQRRTVEPLLSEVGKWSQYLQSIGATPEQAFSELLKTEHALRTGSPEQKAQAFAYLANLYGIQLPAMNNGDGTQTVPDPYYATMAHQVTALSQEVMNLRQQSTLSERQRAEAEFNALAAVKDQSGTPKFPHFERVRQTMLQLAAEGRAETWDQAYEDAVWLDRDLRQQTIDAKLKSERDAIEKARQEAVEKARKASPVRTSNAMPRGDVKGKGLDAILGAAIDHHLS